ncbi:hypothetical protein JCM33374_g3286 [Metschnikowia sp. JCM 33374]|nr:hypothetical protein JCM33374_g3286 [Metschnikowia sp. JCM 33374]
MSNNLNTSDAPGKSTCDSSCENMFTNPSPQEEKSYKANYHLTNIFQMPRLAMGNINTIHGTRPSRKIMWMLISFGSMVTGVSALRSLDEKTDSVCTWSVKKLGLPKESVNLVRPAIKALISEDWRPIARVVNGTCAIILLVVCMERAYSVCCNRRKIEEAKPYKESYDEKRQNILSEMNEEMQENKNEFDAELSELDLKEVLGALAGIELQEVLKALTGIELQEVDNTSLNKGELLEKLSSRIIIDVELHTTEKRDGTKHELSILKQPRVEKAREKDMKSVFATKKKLYSMLDRHEKAGFRETEEHKGKWRRCLEDICEVLRALCPNIFFSVLIILSCLYSFGIGCFELKESYSFT